MLANKLQKMKSILILEDEELLGRIYAKNLIKKGYHVDWVACTEDAIKAAEKTKYDIVALDNTLSEKRSGLDLLPEMRKMLPEAKIIMLSNQSQFLMEKKAKALGADGYLLKLNTTPESFIDFAMTL